MGILFGALMRQPTVTMLAASLAAALPLLAGCASSQRVNEASLALQPVHAPLEVSGALAGGAGALLDPSRHYEIGPEDVLALRVLDLERAGQWSDLELTVGPEGYVAVPLAGRVQAAGRTPDALRRELVRRLGERYLHDPQVTLSVAHYKARRIAVLGAVEEPGVKELERNAVSLTEALALAGGLSREAGAQALLFRHVPEGSPQAVEVSLEGLAYGELENNQVLGNGDVLQVLPAPAIHVVGYVTKPGEFRLHRRLTVLGAIALAGGLQIPDASPSETFVRRRRPDGGETVLHVDLVAISEGRAHDLPLRGGDIVEVQQTTARYVAVGAYDFFRGFLNVGFNLASLF